MLNRSTLIVYPRLPDGSFQFGTALNIEICDLTKVLNWLYPIAWGARSSCGKAHVAYTPGCPDRTVITGRLRRNRTPYAFRIYAYGDARRRCQVVRAAASDPHRARQHTNPILPTH